MKFAFTATKSGATFECRVDGGAWSACTSPKTLDGLAAGSHTFEVRSKDRAGNRDATPASRTWTVEAATQPSAPASSPAGGENSGSAPSGGGSSSVSRPDPGRTAPTGPATPAAPSVAFTAAKGKLAAVLAKGLALAVTTQPGTALRAQVVLDAKTAKRLHLGRGETVLGSATAVATGTSAKMVVKLSAKARKALKRLGSVRLTVRVTGINAGVSGFPVERAVTIRR